MYCKIKDIWVFGVTDFKYDVKFDLRGHLEVAMTSDTIKTAMTGNMHCIWMSGQVIDAIELDSQVKSDHRGRLGDHNELPILCRSP